MLNIDKVYMQYILVALMASGRQGWLCMRVARGQFPGRAGPICKYTVYTWDQNASSDTYIYIYMEILHQLYDLVGSFRLPIIYVFFIRGKDDCVHC